MKNENQYKTGLPYFLSAFGTIIIIISVIAGIILCINAKDAVSHSYGLGSRSYTTEEWQPIGLVWMFGTWIAGTITGSVFFWMSDMLEEQEKQSKYLEKLILKKQAPAPVKKSQELPIKITSKQNYSVGDNVHHAEYGNGKIIELTGIYAVVEFYNGNKIAVEKDSEKMNKV